MQYGKQGYILICFIIKFIPVCLIFPVSADNMLEWKTEMTEDRLQNHSLATRNLNIPQNKPLLQAVSACVFTALKEMCIYSGMRDTAARLKETALMFTSCHVINMSLSFMSQCFCMRDDVQKK